MPIAPKLASLAVLLAGVPALSPAPAFAQGGVSGQMTPSRELDQETLGAGGLQKCAAYKRVQRHSDALQASDHGQLTPGDTRRLAAELKQARAMAPAKLSPADCGVPL